MNLSPADQQQLTDHGVSLEQVEEQLMQFASGISPLEVVRPCTIGDGIRLLKEEELPDLQEGFRAAMKQGRVTKMVPASGAASRMFQALQMVADRDDLATVTELRQAEQQAQVRDTLILLDNLELFPFFGELSAKARERGSDLREELASGKYKALLSDLLEKTALGYPTLPKALLPFHQYGDLVRTAVEEHLQEALHYARDEKGRVSLHLTMSPEHKAGVEALLRKAAATHGLSADQLLLSFSEQHAFTDTIAVDPDNKPFRDEVGRLVLRPGGHGALLENLQELNGDIVFIKNIDNVAHDRHLPLTVTWKQALGGLLLRLQGELFNWLLELSRPDLERERLQELFRFLQDEMQLKPPAEILKADPVAQVPWLIARLNRPLRVCGLVENEGEPGGGPFRVKDENGMETLQLVESAQIDLNDPDQKVKLAASTHFSPVDLVCGMRDFRGVAFELHRYRDPDTGMITEKSSNGRRLKALELPGLWNGSMAHWNTLFVEVPPLTFNPVKTVLDLLRPPHQPENNIKM